MALARMVPWWFFAIVLGRDVYLLLAAAILLGFTGRRKFPPSVWGKASTFVQILAVDMAFAAALFGLGNPWPPATAMIWISAAFTVWSGVEYTWRGIALAQRFRIQSSD
jgi:cardiolipin synthase